VVILLGLVTFSSFVSSITNAMTQLRSMHSENIKQLLVFQRYISCRKISPGLAARMRRHLKYQLVKDRKRKRSMTSKCCLCFRNQS